jgi:CheY-like chemotaxis protein/tRNA A-37 threonylcarbamoyl transferase component Bud32
LARILLAEDYDDLRELISELLRSQEHVVEAFDNGGDAQAQLCTRNYDLAILDWELPKVLGIDIVKNHRKQGGTTPILMLTGKKAVTDKEEGFDAGADDYLTKPFHPKELTARVKALLRRANATVGSAISLAEMETGTVFADRYEIISTLGRGSTGIIYKARHMYLNRLVAVKVLHPQLVSETDSVSRFKREAQAVSALSHPNIIEIHDFGITMEGVPYLVMDFSGGETLMGRIAMCDHLPFNEALPIFIQLCEALDHAHSHGVIHRDVKPANILIIRDEQGEETLKIVDFGIAKIEQKGEAMWSTQNGDVLGSPLYMSPEQCMGAPLDARTDIFSLGCVMYTTLMGCEPFIGENVLDTMYRRTVEDPRPFAEMRPDLDLPQALEVIIMKALARETCARYQTMNELKVDLEQLACALA